MNLRILRPALITLTVVTFLAPHGANAQAVRFQRGDVDLSGSMDIGDPLALLLHVFLGQPPTLACESGADANDDGAVDFSDAITMLSSLFLGGGHLPAPYPGCGADPTPDGLTCESSPGCPDTDPTGFLARLDSRTVMPLDAETIGSIDAFDQETFDFLNMTYDPDSEELRGPALPLSGKWVEVAGKRFMTDRDGYLALPERPEAGSTLSVYWHVTDSDPVVSLDAETLQVVPADGEPPVTELPIGFEYPEHMDGVSAAPAGNHKGAVCTPLQIPPGCPGTNRVACCEDYLGPYGDGHRYTRGACLPLAVRNYYGSLCYQWTFLKRGKPCFNEGAINHLGPGCWHNHKYRNCQNMDEDDFSFRRVGRDTTFRFGEDVEFFGRNNTAANSTVLQVVPDVGEFVVPPGSGYRVVRDEAAGGWRVDQWSDVNETHYEDFNVLFRATERYPNGDCIGNYTILAMADGLVETVQLLGLPSQGVWQGTATRTFLVDDEPSGFFESEKETAIIDSWNPATHEISGTLTIHYSTRQEGDACRLEGEATLPLTARPALHLRIDYEAEPPTYEAGSDGEHVEMLYTAFCQTEDGIVEQEFTELFLSRWLSTTGPNEPYFLSDDGCECRGANVLEGDGFTAPTVYEWNLRMIPGS